MPVRAHCPHCITPCQVAEQYLGVPIKCAKCGQTFTVQPTVLAGKPHSTESIPPGETVEVYRAAPLLPSSPDRLAEPEAINSDRSTAKLGLLALAIVLGAACLVAVALLIATAGSPSP
jgi:hypothetical protein